MSPQVSRGTGRDKQVIVVRRLTAQNLAQNRRCRRILPHTSDFFRLTAENLAAQIHRDIAQGSGCTVLAARGFAHLIVQDFTSRSVGVMERLPQTRRGMCIVVAVLLGFGVLQ